MTPLGLVGIADKGTYSAEATYNKGQFVLYDGSTWLALKDNLNGVTPAEGENWKYLARGFAAELLSLVTAIDSQGLSGSQGGQVNAQSLIDVLADKVANQLIAKSMMSNVQVNDAEKVPTSALAYSMQQAIETLNSKMLIKSTNIKFGMCNINCFRVGNIAMIQCVSGTVDIIADSILFTIPEGYRPCADIDFPTRSPDFGAGIDINGNFVMYGVATNIPLRFTVAYIASD